MKKLVSLLKFVWSHPLNKDGHTPAIRRVISWQIASRVLPYPVHLPFVDHTVLVVERGMSGATGNWYCGLHESAEMLFALRLLRPDDLFVDVGANIGSYTVMAAGAVGAKTIAFEPIPVTFERLQRNIVINSLDSLVDAHQAGISDRPGTIRFTRLQDTVNHVATTEDSEACIDVRVTSLDIAIRGKSPTLIKIDIEGHELAALQGAAVTLETDSLLAVLVETNGSGARYGVRDDHINAIMSDHGYCAYSYAPASGTLRRGKSELNSIFIRDLHSVERRLRTARAFRLCNGKF